MATVIHDRNEPERTEVVREYHRETDGSGIGTILGVILAIIILALLFIYGLPALRGAGNDVPNRIDVNLNTPSPAPGAGAGIAE